MVNIINNENLEDIYEKTYLIIRLLIKNISSLKINEKFVKLTFMKSRTFFFLKNLILRLKKSLYSLKNFPTKDTISASSDSSHKKKNIKLVDMLFLTRIDFLFKSVNLVLKFTEKYKTLSVKTNTSWCFKKFYSKLPKRKLFLANLFLRKVILKFLNSYLIEGKKLKVSHINRIVFYIHSFEYKNIYNFY
jgi:hypothetical protein